jgi:hypothetical protein
MTTINDLRQKIENEYLEPVIEQTPSVPLSNDINSSTSTITIVGDILSPDEESLIGPGSLLEIDSELVRVLSYDQNNTTITCTRGVRGTTAAAHTAANSELRFPTRWPRKVIEDAISAAIDSLWQPLYAPKEKLATVATAEYLRLPLNTVRLIGVEYRNLSGEWEPVTATLFATHPTDPDFAAIQLGPIGATSVLCNVRYGLKIEAPSSTTDEIENLEAKWERIVMADVGAQLLSGVDIDATTQEVLTRQFRLDRFPVRSGITISQALIRYREYLIEQAYKDLKARYPVKIYQRPVHLFG